jgi:transcriptional regulator with XRE-family HTH domain
VPRKRNYIASVDEKAIGERIKQLRKRRGLSQVELAQQLGMDQSLLSRYERGELRLHGALLASLAQVFRTSADEILGLKQIKQDGLLRDRRFLRRIYQIDGLSKRKKQALLTTLDSFLNEQRRP